MANETLACPHGSIWCGRCRHNIHRFGPHSMTDGHSVMMGRPKYPPRGSRASKKAMKGGNKKQ